MMLFIVVWLPKWRITLIGMAQRNTSDILVPMVNPAIITKRTEAPTGSNTLLLKILKHIAHGIRNTCRKIESINKSNLLSKVCISKSLLFQINPENNNPKKDIAAVIAMHVMTTKNFAIKISFLERG